MVNKLAASLVAGALLAGGTAAARADAAASATALHRGGAERAFYDAYLAAKRESPRSPIKALVESTLWAFGADRAPRDPAADPEGQAEDWLAYAEAMDALGRDDAARQALAAAGDTVRRTQPARVAALQHRLALRAAAAISGKATPAAGGGPLAEFNAALVARRGRDDPLPRLQRLTAEAAPEVRDRAVLWIALLRADAGDVAAARQALAAVDAGSPLAVDAALSWARVAAEASPAAVAAAERMVAARLQSSPATWELRAALVARLLARGAVSQAGELAADGFASANEQLERIDQQLARLAQAPLADALGAVDWLPETARRHIRFLGERREALQATERALNGWLPYLYSFRGRLQKDAALFATELRDRFGAEREVALKAGGTREDRRALLRHDLDGLFGTPPQQGDAARLFRGLARWELGADVPADWAPDAPAGDPLRALEYAGQLLDLAAAQAPRRFAADAPAERAKALAERNAALVNEVRAALPALDRAQREAVLAGLRDRRRLVQQWLVRLGEQALFAYQRHVTDAGEPRFELPDVFAPRPGEALVGQLEKSGDASRPAAAVRTNLSLVSSTLRTIAEGGETRVLRAAAIELQARIVIALCESQAIAQADEAAALYRTLLRDYADLVDTADAGYQMARAHELSKRAADSLAALAAVAASHPADPRGREAVFRTGELHFAAGDFAQARLAYEKVIGQGDPRLRDLAEYKLGWTLYRLGEYREALPHFVAVVDRAAAEAGGGDRFRSDRVRDAFRALALTFSNLEGANEVERYFTRAGRRQYLPEIYASIAALYIERERVQDAAQAYASLIRQYPNQRRAPEVAAGIVRAAERGGLPRLAVAQKEDFVERYAAGGAFWRQADAATRERIAADLRPFLVELSALYHADAQQQKSAASRDKAVRLYGRYIDAFPADPRTPELLFMRGEARFEAGDLAGALADYEKSAYEHGAHPRAAEASYASLVTAEKLIAQGRNSDERRARLRDLVARSGRFAGTFQGDTRVDAVLVKAGEDILMLGEPAEAVTLGENLLARNPPPEVRRRAQVLLAHGLFESQAFARAEAAYRQAIAAPGGDPAAVALLSERLAQSAYRQAEAARAAGDLAAATAGFQRAAEAAPATETAASATIDAAVALLEQKRWSDAIGLLERFLRERSAHRLAAGVPLRLAFAYEQAGRLLEAADMNERLAEAGAAGPDRALAAQQLTRAGELRARAGRPDLALPTFERFLARFPEPLEPAVEMRQRLADLAARAGDAATRERWLADLIAAQAAAGDAAGVRVRFLAARAHLAIGDLRNAEFEKIVLRLPLDKALADKRRAMEQAVRWYDGAARFALAEVTTAATHQTAEIYRRLARDIVDSERPAGLKPLELEQYKILLEEEALPFDDKATQLHEINAGRIAEGLYDDWVRRSMVALRALSPGRYDRVEVADSWFDYAIPKPAAPATPAVPAVPANPGSAATPASPAVPAAAPARPVEAAHAK